MLVKNLIVRKIKQNSEKFFIFYFDNDIYISFEEVEKTCKEIRC